MENPSEIPPEHQLWVKLSSLADGNVFKSLPNLMKRMLYADLQIKSVDLDDNFNYILPSDYGWQTNIYFKMVEKQRTLDSSEKGMSVLLRDEGVVKLHEWNIKPKPAKTRTCLPEVKRLTEKTSVPQKRITWTVEDIVKAGCLLTTPPISTQFDDEQEMRRVYTLIYDVFRYKNILNRALCDVSFFVIYSELNKCIPIVWLLLFDLYHRGFKKRETCVMPTVNELFTKYGLAEAESALWAQRVKLAAAVARLRIQHSALNLTQLLPRHLRDDRISDQPNDTPVTCWVNVKKIRNLDEINRELQKLLNMRPVDDLSNLQPDTFKWDKHCPQFLVFHPSVRTKLAQSPLVRKHKLVVQDRSFCLGPATFGKVIENLQLTGCVIQSHVSSPRATAYLAAILSQNDRIKKLMAFSAGQRKTEYEKYFNELGMNNITIYSDKLIDIPPDAYYLQEAIAVFATPPNSYSAVSDPIDLVCSRGGDLSMLEVLTETEETTEGRKRVLSILEEQRNTLRFAMSRPQIQFVLYETHSQLEAENNGMVQKAVKEINKLAKMHHAALQGKINVPPCQSQIIKVTNYDEINNNEKLLSSGDDSIMGFDSSLINHGYDADERLLKDVDVPECDLFDVPKLPDLCPNEDYCLKLSKEGCFLALLQRKQVLRMDNKYLIEIAESRGLFGNNSSASGQTKGSKSSKTSRKKMEKNSPPPKFRKKIKPSQIARIAAPTVSSMNHSAMCDSINTECSRNRTDTPESKVPQSRRWWSETTRHLSELRTSLVKQKLLPSVKNSPTDDKPTEKPLDSSSTTKNNSTTIDEIYVKNSKKSRVPVFPKLHLTRNNNNNKKGKIPLPLTVTLVEFPFRKPNEMAELKQLSESIIKVQNSLKEQLARITTNRIQAALKKLEKERRAAMKLKKLKRERGDLEIQGDEIEDTDESDYDPFAPKHDTSTPENEKTGDEWNKKKTPHPYRILESLTSYQIRALVSPAYNPQKDNIITMFEPQKHPKIKPTIHANKKRKRSPISEIVERVARPTKASKLRDSSEDTKLAYGTIIKPAANFNCELCRKRNMKLL